jgi:molybdopterin converting factor small subunit
MVRITFFAGLRDLAGSSAIEIPWFASLTMAQLRRRVVEQHPKVEGLLKRSRAVIGDALVEDNASVPQGAEVCFLPPVSGG